VFADCHVFRHVTASLTKEPDRCAVDGLAQAGAHKATAAVWVKIGTGREVRSLGTHSYKASIAGTGNRGLANLLSRRFFV
jgi:hypothetical protein